MPWGGDGTGALAQARREHDRRAGWEGERVRGRYRWRGHRFFDRNEMKKFSESKGAGRGDMDCARAHVCERSAVQGGEGAIHGEG
jgi:hypothetical protein